MLQSIQTIIATILVDKLGIFPDQEGGLIGLNANYCSPLTILKTFWRDWIMRNSIVVTVAEGVPHNGMRSVCVRSEYGALNEIILLFLPLLSILKA